MGTAVVSVFLFLALLLAPPQAAGSEEPVVLLAPLIASSGTDGAAASLVNRKIEENLRLLGGFSLAGAEESEDALAELSREAQIGPEALLRATGRAGADYAVVGQFLLDEDTLNFDLRLFSSAEEAQVSSFQKPAPPDSLFEVLAEAAIFVAEGVGAEVTSEERQRLAVSSPPSLEAYRTLLAALGEGNAADRLSLLQIAVGLAPDYLDANLHLGLELYGLGRKEEALPYVKKASSLGVDMPEVHNNLAVIYADLGESKEAMKEFRRALELKPDYWEAKLNYGRLLEEEGRFDRAEGEYTELLQEDPDNFKARSSLALLFDRTGRPELSIREFRILSRTNPELAEDFFLESGKGARKAKDFEKAEKFFLRAVDINPKLARGYAELGTNSYLAGDYRRSMEYFRQAIALEPQQAKFHHYLGMALEKEGLQEEAKDSFERSAELGGPLETRIGLARSYLAAGEVILAIDELKLALDEDPSQEEAKQLLARAVDRAETEQKRAEERASFATHRLDRLESIIDDLTRTNRELENRLLTVRADRERIDRELQMIRDTGGERDEEYGQRMEEAIDSIKEIREGDVISRVQEECELRVKDLKDQLNEARQEVVDLETLLPRLESEGGECAREKRDNVSLSRKLKKAESEIDSAREEIGRLEDKVDEGVGKARASRRELDLVRGRLETLREKKEKEGRELSKTREQNRGLAAKAKQLEKDLEAALKDLSGLTADLGRRREKESARDEDIVTLREKVSALEAKEKILEKDLEQERERLRDLTAGNADLNGELARLEVAAASSREEADGLKERLAALELESSRQLEEVRKEADAAVGALEEKVARLEQDAAEREEEYLSERERLEQTVAEMERRRNEAEGWYRQAYQAEKVSREALEQARLELSEQSMELGKVNMGRRDWDKARLYFLKALEIDPRSREAYYSLGEVYFQLGRFDLSKEMYEKAGQ
jgi:Tfp pilus assembly protein PilF